MKNEEKIIKKNKKNNEKIIEKQVQKMKND